MSDIWKHPGVKSALKAGRPADDIMVMRCPNCDDWNYYNQGSHYSCRACNKTWYCCSEGEEPPEDRAYLFIDECSPCSLSDTVTVTTEGYDNETP